METLGDLVFDLRRTAGGRRVRLSVRRESKWETWSATDLVEHVHALALALDNAGLVKGDRLAIVAGDHPEHLILDLACQVLGVVTVPIPLTLQVPQIARVLRNSASRWVAFDGTERRQMLGEVTEALTTPPTFLSLDGTAIGDDAGLTGLLGWGAGRRGEIPLERFRDRLAPEDPATLIYSTTTDAEIEAAAISQETSIQHALACAEAFRLDEADRVVSTAARTDPWQRALDYACLLRGSAIHFLDPGEPSATAVGAEQPTVLVTDTATLEALRASLESRVAKLGGITRRLTERALVSAMSWAAARRAGRHRVVHGRWVHWVLDPLFLEPIRRVLGGRLRWIVVAEPVPASLADFFAALRLSLRTDTPSLDRVEPVRDAQRPPE